MHSNLVPASRRASQTAFAVVLAGALLIALTPGSAAAAGATGAGGSGTSVSTSTSQSCPAPVANPADRPPDLLAGVSIGPALVKTPGKPDRTLTADQATAYIQSWLPSSIYEHIPAVKPPAGVPISMLYMPSTYAGQTVCISSWFAQQGTQAWVGMPAQGLGWASVPKDTWIAAPIPARSIAAFAGHVKAVEGGPTTTSTATTTTVPAASSDKAAGTGGSSSSTNPLVVVIPAIVILAGLGVWLLVKSRRRANVA